MFDIAKITPEPTPEQRVLIEQAIMQAWPKQVVPAKQVTDAWRFSRRRWS